MPSAKSKKKHTKTEYVSVYDVFPWLRSGLYDHKRDSPEAKEKARKRMERAERLHPRAHSKAFGEKVKLIRDGEKTLGFIIHDPQYFIDSADLDNAQRKAYEGWLNGQTRPLIPGVKAASYVNDYNRFREGYVNGYSSSIND